MLSYKVEIYSLFIITNFYYYYFYYYFGAIKSKTCEPSFLNWDRINEWPSNADLNWDEVARFVSGSFCLSK